MDLHRGLLAAALFSAVGAVGCIGPAEQFVPLDGELESLDRFDFSNQANVFSAGPLAYEPARARFHVFLNPQGVLLVDKNGEPEGAIPFATTSMFDMGVGGMTVLPDGRYVIVAGQTVRVFDAEADEELDNFQVERRYNDNDGWTEAFAVTWDGQAEELVVSVQHWSWQGFEASFINELQRFTLDGAHVENVGIVLKDEDGNTLAVEGIARHPTEDAYLIAANDQLGMVSRDGGLLAGGTMPDITFAGGLTLDVDAGRVWVTDTNNIDAHAYDLGLFSP